VSFSGWRGVVEEYREFMPVDADSPVVTLHEGGTPLVHAPALSHRLGADVWLKVEGANPTGSFKDRGMTLAISKAVEDGAKAVVCASTGNTSASAAAYATRAGLTCAVLIPEGYIALGKLAQALVHGARVLQIRGNFDHAFELVKALADREPITIVNSVNPFRIEGQKTAAFEIVDVLGDAPDMHCIPASWRGAVSASSESGGGIHAVSDQEILSAYRFLAGTEAVFCEPSSAASVAGLLKVGIPEGVRTVVCTLTGHGLKDPDRAIAEIAVPSPVDADIESVRAELGL